MSKVTEFAQIRERAKNRRDNALAKIRESYEEALSQRKRLTLAACGPIASVSRHVTKLRELKLIRRVRKHNVNTPAVYIRDEKAAERTLNDKPLDKVIAELVAEPMRTMEVVMMLQEAGWKTTMAAEHFRTHVQAALWEVGEGVT